MLECLVFNYLLGGVVLVAGKLAQSSLKRVLFEFLYKIVNAPQFLWNAYILRAVRDALAAGDAVAGLAKLGHSAVVANEEGTSCLTVVFGLLALWHISLVHALVVVHEDGWDVESIRTRHAVFAVVAGNRRVGNVEVGYFVLKPFAFLFTDGH